MRQSIVHVALVVRDYDEAIAFYTQKLRFTLVEDTDQPEQDKRWVVVAPPGSHGTTLLLARASKPEQEPFAGNQTGGRVFLFLSTDDFQRDYERMLREGVRFVRPPASAPYGTVAVFEDLYGNLWDLVQYAPGHPNATGRPIRWRMHLRSAPERVFEALDRDDGRAAFWAESAIERDGAIDFRFVNGASHQARIVERRPPSVFAIDYFGAVARFELAPDGRGGTDLLLVQDGVPVHDWDEVHAGWLNVLFPLKAWVDHGVDLRNHDPSRSWDAGYADQ